MIGVHWSQGVEHVSTYTILRALTIVKTFYSLLYVGTCQISSVCLALQQLRQWQHVLAIATTPNEIMKV